MTGIVMQSPQVPFEPMFRRHAVPIAVTLLVHGVVLALVLSMRTPVPELAAVPVLIRVVVPVSTASVAPKAVPPPKREAYMPTQVRPSPTAAARTTPVKAVPSSTPEPAQTSAPQSATDVAADVMPSLAQTASQPSKESEIASIDPPRYEASYLNNPQPPYPTMSRKLREQGSVRLQVMVTAAGEPEMVRIKRSSGFVRLDQAAIDAVQKWRFVPARQQGQAVAGLVEIPIQFNLEN